MGHIDISGQGGTVRVDSGVGPFDERTGGFRDGGLYLLGGGPGSGKLTFILQVLERGLRNGERVALLSAAAPEEILEQAEFWGFDFETPWKQGRCVLLGFRGEYPRRVVHAPDPGEAFAELGRLLEGPVARLGIDPGAFLWETRAGTAMAQQFVDWVHELGATTLATFPGDGEPGQGPSSEWVRQRSQGVFLFARHPRGLHEVRVARLAPPVDEPGPISLELTPGNGFGPPTGRLDRRRVGGARPDSRRLLLLRMADGIPPDLETWLGRRYDVEMAEDPLRCISRLQAEPWGVLCVYADRARAEEAIQACRTARGATSAVIVILSDEPLRSTDCARALDAGCDDVLSGSVDLRELESRLRRAAETAHRGPAPEPVRPEPAQAPFDAETFARTVEERLLGEELGQFSLLHVESGAREDMDGILFENARAEQGDLVGPMRTGWGVLLQGARAQQAEAYLQRVREALATAGSDRTLSAEILASPEQSERIRALLGR
ncbi:MAG: ATPase domain-containing protein [Gemmatimonadota bacterium]